MPVEKKLPTPPTDPATPPVDPENPEPVAEPDEPESYRGVFKHNHKKLRNGAPMYFHAHISFIADKALHDAIEADEILKQDVTWLKDE